MTSNIQFSSVLGAEYHEELEKLMFFNPGQEKALPGIYDSINEYGLPSIVEEGERLRINVEGLGAAQTLFALDQQGEKNLLVGVMVFCRISIETIVLLHIAVLEEYSWAGKFADEMVVLRLMSKLREIAKRLKGVQNIRLQYASGLTVPV